VRGCFFGLFLVAAIVVFLGAVAFALLAPAPGLPPQFTPVAVSTAAAGRFDTKIATVQAATGPTTIAINEEEATSRLVALLATEANAPKIDRPQIAFRNGRVYLSGTSNDTPIPIGFVITGRVEAVEGKPKIVIENVEAGRFPVSGALRSQVDTLVAEQERLLGEQPIYVTEVQVLDGKLVVTGRPR